MSAWTDFLKAYASKNKMKYNEAMKDPKVKDAWKKEKAKMAKGKK